MNLADVKAKMAAQLTACPRPSLFYTGRILPSSAAVTVLVVAALARPDALVEVEVTAIRP